MTANRKLFPHTSCWRCLGPSGPCDVQGSFWSSRQISLITFDFASEQLCSSITILQKTRLTVLPQTPPNILLPPSLFPWLSPSPPFSFCAADTFSSAFSTLLAFHHTAPFHMSLQHPPPPTPPPPLSHPQTHTVYPQSSPLHHIADYRLNPSRANKQSQSGKSSGRPCMCMCTFSSVCEVPDLSGLTILCGSSNINLKAAETVDVLKANRWHSSVKVKVWNKLVQGRVRVRFYKSVEV